MLHVVVLSYAQMVGVAVTNLAHGKRWKMILPLTILASAA
jgi:hypothetical protein